MWRLTHVVLTLLSYKEASQPGQRSHNYVRFDMSMEASQLGLPTEVGVHPSPPLPHDVVRVLHAREFEGAVAAVRAVAPLRSPPSYQKA